MISRVHFTEIVQVPSILSIFFSILQCFAMCYRTWNADIFHENMNIYQSPINLIVEISRRFPYLTSNKFSRTSLKSRYNADYHNPPIYHNECHYSFILGNIYFYFQTFDPTIRLMMSVTTKSHKARCVGIIAGVRQLIEFVTCRL